MAILKRLLFIACLFGLISFQKDNFDYKFNISSTQDKDSIPENITIQIINNEKNEIQLSNLIFTFYLDKSGFWGTLNSVRFLDKKLILKPDEQFNKTIIFDSLTFTDFDKYKIISEDSIKTRMKNSKIIIIKATISDNGRPDNPLSPGSLTNSNIIEIKKNRK